MALKLHVVADDVVEIRSVTERGIRVYARVTFEGAPEWFQRLITRQLPMLLTMIASARPKGEPEP